MAAMVSALSFAKMAKVGSTEAEEGAEAEEDGATPCIKVCVRVRPFIKEELEGSRSGGVCQLCIDMPTKTSTVMFGKGPDPKVFEFDRCYWSHSSEHPLFANQETLYQEQGVDMINKALKGYNNCIFAYGQTGSGKSYSVVGGKSIDQQGLLPRIVTGLFERFDAMDASVKKTCKVSFLEVYNEQINDLLGQKEKGDPNEVDEDGNPMKKKEQKLEVRQHPTLGTFVPGLTECLVNNRDEVMDLVDYGNTLRAVSATAMNASSSRSHCMFSFKTSIESGGKVARSQTHLVDLAGSERAGRTKATGDRLKEGAAINQSLSALARVISELAKMSDPKVKNKKKIQVPWRQSKLTFILKDSLSGNSMTAMMAAISPNMPDYEETISTMQFCQTVKMVQTAGKKNEANDVNVEDMLKREVARLQEQISELLKEKEARADLLSKEENLEDQRKSTLARIQARKAIIEDGTSVEMEHLRNWYEAQEAEKENQTGEDEQCVKDDESAISEDDDVFDDDPGTESVQYGYCNQQIAAAVKEEMNVNKQVDRAKHECERLHQEFLKAQELEAEAERKREEELSKADPESPESRPRPIEELEEIVEKCRQGGFPNIMAEEQLAERKRKQAEEEERQEARLKRVTETARRFSEAKMNMKTSILKKRQQLWDQMQQLISKLQEVDQELMQWGGSGEAPGAAIPGFFIEYCEEMKRIQKQKATAPLSGKRRTKGKSIFRRASPSQPIQQELAKGDEGSPTDKTRQLSIDMSKVRVQMSEYEEDIFSVGDILQDLNDERAWKTDLRVIVTTDPEYPDVPGLIINSRRYSLGENEMEELREEEFLKGEDFKARLEWLMETHASSRIVSVQEDEDGAARVQYNKLGDVWALANKAKKPPTLAQNEVATWEGIDEGAINVSASMAFSFDIADNHLQCAEAALQAIETRRIREKNLGGLNPRGSRSKIGTPGGSANTGSNSGFATYSSENLRPWRGEVQRSGTETWAMPKNMQSHIRRALTTGCYENSSVASASMPVGKFAKRSKISKVGTRSLGTSTIAKTSPTSSRSPSRRESLFSSDMTQSMNMMAFNLRG